MQPPNRCGSSNQRKWHSAQGKWHYGWKPPCKSPILPFRQPCSSMSQPERPGSNVCTKARQSTARSAEYCERVRPGAIQPAVWREQQPRRYWGLEGANLSPIAAGIIKQFCSGSLRVSASRTVVPRREGRADLVFHAGCELGWASLHAKSCLSARSGGIVRLTPAAQFLTGWLPMAVVIVAQVAFRPLVAHW